LTYYQITNFKNNFGGYVRILCNPNIDLCDLIVKMGIIHKILQISSNSQALLCQSQMICHFSSNYPNHITWQIYSANKYSEHTIFILKSYTRARIIKTEDNEIRLYVSTISANENVRHIPFCQNR
jgi:hypothetical protein